MTPEQLDEIEKQVNEFGEESGFILPLVKAVREAREEWNYEWEQRHQMEVKLLATEAEVEQLREIVKTAGDRLRACGYRMTEQVYQEMASVLFALPTSVGASE